MIFNLKKTKPLDKIVTSKHIEIMIIINILAEPGPIITPFFNPISSIEIGRLSTPGYVPVIKHLN